MYTEFDFQKQDIFEGASRVRIIYTDSTGNGHVSSGTPIRWGDEVSWVEHNGCHLYVNKGSIVDVQAV